MHYDTHITRCFRLCVNKVIKLNCKIFISSTLTVRKMHISKQNTLSQLNQLEYTLPRFLCRFLYFVSHITRIDSSQILQMFLKTGLIIQYSNQLLEMTFLIPLYNHIKPSVQYCPILLYNTKTQVCLFKILLDSLKFESVESFSNIWTN